MSEQVTAESDALVREVVAEMIRDHTMPPSKDLRGYDYRMGWWDAVTFLDSLVKRRLREARVIPPTEPCEDCGGTGRTVQGWTDKSGEPEDQYGPCNTCVIPSAMTQEAPDA